MSDRIAVTPPEIVSYIRSVSLREPEVLGRLRAAIAERHRGGWHMPPEQAQFISLLLGIAGASRVLEIGTFAGYSALWMALAMPAGSKVVTCEINEDFAALGPMFWEEAGVADRIDLRMGDALATVARLKAEGTAAFDAVLIDADKGGYPDYYEACWPLLRIGGLMLIDNVLWRGSVLDNSDQRRSTAAIRTLNQQLRDDRRIDLSTLSIGDGLTVARKLTD